MPSGMMMIGVIVEVGFRSDGQSTFDGLEERARGREGERTRQDKKTRRLDNKRLKN